jgi:putative endonuclease
MLISPHHYYVYLLTNTTKKVLYTGVTNDLRTRIIEHYLKRGDTTSFASKYFCYWLVFYEEFKYINNAIAREKEIKGWTRLKKEQLITSFNPTWMFLNKEVCGEWPPSKDVVPRSQ